jgi:hypothetical protein
MPERFMKSNGVHRRVAEDAERKIRMGKFSLSAQCLRGENSFFGRLERVIRWTS